MFSNTKEKVKIFPFLAGSVCLLLALLFFSSWKQTEVLAMLLCFLGGVLWPLMLTEGVISFLQGDKKRATVLFVLKLPLMAITLAGSVHFMENLVLLPLALYLGQMAIFFLSLRGESGGVKGK